MYRCAGWPGKTVRVLSYVFFFFEVKLSNVAGCVKNEVESSHHSHVLSPFFLYMTMLTFDMTFENSSY